VQMLILDQINAFYWIDMLEGEEPRTFKAICTHLSKLDMSIFASKVCACCRLPSPAFGARLVSWQCFEFVLECRTARRVHAVAAVHPTRARFAP
jgi:hypothetical protein